MKDVPGRTRDSATTDSGEVPEPRRCVDRTIHVFALRLHTRECKEYLDPPARLGCRGRYAVVPPNVLLDTSQITDTIEKRVSASTKPAPSSMEASDEVAKTHPSTSGVLHAFNERITVRRRSSYSGCPRVQGVYTLEVTRWENDRRVLTFGVSSQYFNRLGLRCTKRTACIHC